MYLLDADWVISFLNGRANAVELLARLADDGVALSIITWGEIYEGLLGVPDAMGRISQLEAFTAALDLVTLDLEIARSYGQLRSTLRAQGSLIPDNDLWVAATALAHDLTLVSRDRHFARVPGLKRAPSTEREA